MARIIIALLIVSLTVYTLIDCARTPASATPARISKPAWLALIFLVPVIGPAIWLYFKYQATITSDSPMSASDIADRLRGKKNAPTGPVAPDDDPDFLARLEAANRRKAYEQRKAEEEKKKGKRAKKHQHNAEDPDDDEPKGLYS